MRIFAIMTEKQHNCDGHIGECRTYKWACMSEKSGRMKIYRWNQGNPAGRRLLEKAGNEEWDDEYLLLLIEYQKLYPASEKFEVFYAKYALAQGNAALALAIAQDGERKRRVSPVCGNSWRSVMSGLGCSTKLLFTVPICACTAAGRCAYPYRRERSRGTSISLRALPAWAPMRRIFLGQDLCAEGSNGSRASMRENASLMYCRRRIRIGWAPTSSAGS